MQSITYYRPGARWLGLAGSAICLVCLIAAAVAIAQGNAVLLLGISILFLMGSLLLTCAFIERRSTLTLTEDSIIIRYPVFDASPEARRRLRKGLPYQDIRSMVVSDYPGDGITSGDSRLCRFHLREGGKFSAYFYHFGKEAEQEIIDELHRRIK